MLPNLVKAIVLPSAATKLRAMKNITNGFEVCPGNITTCNAARNISAEAKDYGTLMKTSFGLIASLSFFGNLLLCLVMFMKRSMLNKPYNILIFNLAVTDMLTGMGNFFFFDNFSYTLFHMLYFSRNYTSAIEMLMCANCLNCYQNTYNSIINGFISFQQNEGLNSIY